MLQKHNTTAVAITTVNNSTSENTVGGVVLAGQQSQPTPDFVVRLDETNIPVFV